MKKRILSGIVMITLCLGAMRAPAQEPENASDYSTLDVAVVTPFEGNFFTDLWGNAVSDLDVRKLIHGYSLICWDKEHSGFAADPQVVSGITAYDNEEGDRTYLVSLCDDLYYSDGTAITAADYAFTVLLEISPQLKELRTRSDPYTYLLGYEDYRSGASSCLRGLRVVNETLLQITVSHEYLPFFYEMALLSIEPSPAFLIAPGCVVRDDGEGVYLADLTDISEREDFTVPEKLTDLYFDENGEEQHPFFTAQMLERTLFDNEDGYVTHPAVCSGPYSLEQYDTQRAVFKKNPFFKGNAGGYPPSIERLSVSVMAHADLISALEENRVGLVSKCVPAETIREGMALTMGENGFSMTNYPRSGLSMICFCPEKEKVHDLTMRKALTLCFDRDSFTAEYVGNFGLRADGYYGVGQWMFQILGGSLGYPVTEPSEDAPPEEQAQYDELISAWEELSVSDIPRYSFDIGEAGELFASQGWSLNEEGEPFREGEDTLRYRERETDGTLEPLAFTIWIPERADVSEVLEKHFGEHLEEAGGSLEICEKPMNEILEAYYSGSRDGCDMLYLSTNFDEVYDPVDTFMNLKKSYEEGMESDGQALSGAEKTEYPAFEKLCALAEQMRRTRPGDLLEYCRSWLEMQVCFSEILPMIPVYSNVYFDFYTDRLHNYQVSDSLSWSEAVVAAWLSDAENADEEAVFRLDMSSAQEEEEALSEGDTVIIED